MTMHEFDYWSALASLTITYLVHSTLLLGGVAVCEVVFRIRSHVLLERLWKLGAVIALFSAPVVCVFGNSLWPIEILINHNEGMGRQTQLHAALHDPPNNGGGKTRFAAATSVTELELPQTQLGVASNANDFPSESTRPYAAPTVRLPSCVPNSLQSNATLPKSMELGNAGFPNRDPTTSITTKSAQLATSTRHTLANSRTLLFRYLVPTLSSGFVLFGIVIVLIRAIRFHRRVSNAADLHDGMPRSLLNDMISRYEVQRPVRLLATEGFCEPGAFGIVHWTIIVPRDMDHRMKPDELRALLAHEIAHLVRGDVIWMWIGRLICSCLAWQPLNFLARRRWQNAVEYLCDDWAMAHGVQGVSLARCLTQIAEWQLDQRLTVQSLAAIGSPGTVSQRVTRLVSDVPEHHGSRVPHRGRMLGVTALAITAMFCFAAPHVRVAAQTDQSTESATAHLPSRPPRNDDVAAKEEHSWLRVEHELQLLEDELQRACDLSEQVPLGPEMAAVFNQLRLRSLVLQRQRVAISQLNQRIENNEMSIPIP